MIISLIVMTNRNSSSTLEDPKNKQRFLGKRQLNALLRSHRKSRLFFPSEQVSDSHETFLFGVGFTAGVV